MSTVISITKHLLLWVAFALLLSPSMCIPDWLESIIMAPSLDPSQYKPNTSSTGSSSTSSSTPPTTNSDTGSEYDDWYDLDEQLPVGSWAAAAHHDTALAYDYALARQLQFEFENDEFVLPDDAFGETGLPQPGQRIDAGGENAEPQTNDESVEDTTWQVQLAQFATTLLLACFGFNNEPRAGCDGNGGDGGGGGGGGGGGPERRGGGGDGGGGRGTGDSAGNSDGGGDNEEGASIFDQVGDTVNGFMSGVGRGMMDALGFEDTEDEGESGGPLPESTDGRIARWRKYVMSWSWQTHDVTMATARHIKRDLDTLGWDVRCMCLSCSLAGTIQRIVKKFLQTCPAIGYTQGFDYACKAILKATGNDETSSLELFKAWAAAAGRVVTDEKTRRKVAQYAFDKCSRAAQDLLLNDAVMDIQGLDKAERASALYTHVFGRLELPEAVQAGIIDETLKAGVHGPGVSSWVTTALLEMARTDANLALNKNLSKGQILAKAAGKVSSFSDLEKAAHTTLPSFMRGYRRALP